MDRTGTSDNVAELSPSTKDNLELLTSFEDGEDAQISGMQLIIERVSTFFGSPAYFIFALLFIAAWMAANGWVAHAGGHPSTYRRSSGCRDWSVRMRCC